MIPPALSPRPKPRPATDSVAGSARRAVPAVLAWVAATAIATGVSAAGVSLVTSRVTDEHAVLSAGDVADLTTAAPPSTAPAPSTTAAPLVTDAPATTVTTSLRKAPPLRRRLDPTATSMPPSGPRTAPTRGTQPEASSATFANRGGVITVRCDADAITLVGARPNDGYRLVVREDGPERVIVEFVASHDTTRLGALCIEGRPVVKDGSRTERSTTTSLPG